MKLAFIFFMSMAAFGQNSQTGSVDPNTPVRDPQAVAIVEQALAALGGFDVHQQFRTAVIRGTARVSDSQDVATFLWEDDFTGNSPEFRKETHSGDSVRIFVSGHGTPTRNHDGKARQLAPQSALSAPPFYLPGVVLTRETRNQSYSVRLIQGPGDGGLVHVRMSLELNQVTVPFGVQDWYFDPVSGLPVRVQYMLPNTEKLGGLTPATIEFSDFRSTVGITVPFQITSRAADNKVRSYTITGVQINVNIDTARFEAQGGRQ